MTDVEIHTHINTRAYTLANTLTLTTRCHVSFRYYSSNSIRTLKAANNRSKENETQQKHEDDEVETENEEEEK